MDLHYECKGCGKTIRAAIGKCGRPLACGRCGKVGTIPGIARQVQATEKQIKRVVRCAARLRIRVWVWLLCILIFLLEFLILLLLEAFVPGGERLLKAIGEHVILVVLYTPFWVGCIAFVLVWIRSYRARKLLTGSGAAIIFLPTFVVYLAPTYVEIQRHAKRLTAAGPRED